MAESLALEETCFPVELFIRGVTIRTCSFRPFHPAAWRRRARSRPRFELAMVLARVLSIAVLFDRAAPGAQLFLAGPRVFGCSARPRRASSKCFSAHQSALLVNPASIRKTR